jgi:predicted transcriptional regulator
MRQEISAETVREGTYKLLAALFEILSSSVRLEILDLLRHNPPESRTFSTIMFTLSKNPAVVSRHLHKLEEYGLVEQKDHGYKITETGKLALNATPKDILELVEQALEIAETLDKVEISKSS